MPRTNLNRHPSGHSSGGFTVIELMAVIAIVSILAVIALSAYQAYVVRSKVSEGLIFAAEAKTSVTEYYYNQNRVMPVDNRQAGLDAPGSYGVFDYMSRLEIISTPRTGVIEITLKVPILGVDNLIQLVPSTARQDETISWTCSRPGCERYFK